MASVWYACKFCTRAYQNPKEFVLHKKKEHPDEYREQKEKRKKVRNSHNNGQSENKQSPTSSISDITSRSGQNERQSRRSSKQDSEEAEEEKRLDSSTEKKEKEITTLRRISPRRHSSSPSKVTIHGRGVPGLCIYCDESFPTQLKMVEHVLVVHKSDRPFQCKYCSKKFKTSSNRNGHEASHIGTVRYDCNYCPKSYTRKTARDYHVTATHTGNNVEEGKSEKERKKRRRTSHSEKVTTSTFKCGFCPIAFYDHDRLVLHEKRHERLTQIQKSRTIQRRVYAENFSCCGESFRSLTAFRQHKTIVHLEKCYECDQCHAKFKWSVQLGRHIRKFHKPGSNSPSKQSPTIDSNNDKKKKIVSPESHSKSHSLSVVQSNSMKYLTIQVYEGSSVYVCNFCKKVIANLKAATDHVRVHTGEQPFECRYCKKQFSYMRTWKAHERIHTGIRPYKCDFCPKSFFSWSSRYGHVKLSHPDSSSSSVSKLKTSSSSGPQTTELPVVDKSFAEKNVCQKYKGGMSFHMCKICRMEFSSLSVALRHIPTHNRQDNDLAKLHKKNNMKIPSRKSPIKTFQEKSKFLTRHPPVQSASTLTGPKRRKRSQSSPHVICDVFHGVKIFICKYCKKEFNKYSAAVRHTQCHTHERQFVCRCEKAFIYKDNLRVHQKKSCHLR